MTASHTPTVLATTSLSSSHLIIAYQLIAKSYPPEYCRNEAKFKRVLIDVTTEADFELVSQVMHTH